MNLDINKLMQVAKGLEATKSSNPQIESVSRGTRIFLEFWGIILLILTFTLNIHYWKILTFIIGAFMYIRGRQLGY